jgi:hypothetical protein
MRACLRILPLFALLAAAFGLSALFAQPANADLIVSLQSCNPSGGNSTCTLVLNYTVNSGGSWMVTLTDGGITVTACNATANDATCNTTSNSATFTCTVTCTAKNTYTVTISGGSGSSPTVTARILSPGNLVGGNGGSAGSISVNVGTTATTTQPVYTTTTTQPVYTTTTTQPVYSTMPAGGQCVASVPTNLGCTSIGVGGYFGNYGNYGNYGCGFSFYSCGGSFFGCGFSSFSCGFNNLFNNCSTFSFFNCGGCNFFVFGNCNFNNFCGTGSILAGNSCVFNPNNCTPGLFCTTSNTTTTTGNRTCFIGITPVNC